MKLIVVGLNHKKTPVEVREKFALGQYDLAQILIELRSIDKSAETIILSTCNRVEIYASGSDAADLEGALYDYIGKKHEIDKKTLQGYMYSYSNEQVVKHLFEVASGLDSLVLGENEILGQCKEAYRTALDTKTCSTILAQLFERSFQCAKDIKTKTKINEGAVSVSSVAVDLAERIFGKLKGEQVLVLGTGEMSLLTLKHLQKAGVGSILISNRTHETAVELAGEFNAEAVKFSDWAEKLEGVDIVISSTASEQPIVKKDLIDRAMKKRRHKPLFMIDIAVPRDIEADVDETDDVYLYNIDDLKSVAATNAKFRARELDACSQIINQRSEEFMRWLQFLEASPVIQSLDHYFQDIIDKEVTGFMAGRPDFEGKEDELRGLAGSIKNKMLQAPIHQIKESSRNGGLVRILDSVISLFKLDRSQTSSDSKEKSKS